MENENLVVFVYGTLKKGYRNHFYLKDATYLGEAETKPDYLLYDCGPYPCLVEAKEGEGKSIKGELYKINQKILRGLDYLEGVPDLYQSAKAKLKDEKVNALIYVYQRSVNRFELLDDCWPRKK